MDKDAKLQSPNADNRSMDLLKTPGIKEQIRTSLVELNSIDPFYRKYAIARLGALRAVEAIDPIIEKYKTEKRQDLKRICIDALGNIGHPRALPVVKDALKSQDEEIRKAALKAFSQIKQAD